MTQKLFNRTSDYECSKTTLAHDITFVNSSAQRARRQYVEFIIGIILNDHHNNSIQRY